MVHHPRKRFLNDAPTTPTGGGGGENFSTLYSSTFFPSCKPSTSLGPEANRGNFRRRVPAAKSGPGLGAELSQG
ncbi:hypothetical protein E2320_000556 [Naja naja]|nr:hypothetical protein E2320_000556 [Naja naja]